MRARVSTGIYSPLSDIAVLPLLDIVVLPPRHDRRRHVPRAIGLEGEERKLETAVSKKQGSQGRPYNIQGYGCKTPISHKFTRSNNTPE